jgi:carbon storage regulator
MLILTRKQGTSIRIGQDVVISVIQTGRRTVKLGIQAPATVKILRGELAADPYHTDVTEPSAEALLLQH